MAAFAVGLMIFAASGLRPAYKAWSGQGTSGYFVAQNKVCHRGCHWAGEFDSPQGRVVLQEVTWEGADPGFSSGSRAAALAEAGETSYVYPPYSVYGLLRTIGSILAGAVLLYFAGRRRSRAA